MIAVDCVNTSLNIPCGCEPWFSIGCASSCVHSGTLRLSRLLSMGPTIVCREQLGRVAEALQDYREIVLLEPSNKVAAAKVTELDVHASA